MPSSSFAADVLGEGAGRLVRSMPLKPHVGWWVALLVGYLYVSYSALRTRPCDPVEDESRAEDEELPGPEELFGGERFDMHGFTPTATLDGRLLILGVTRGTSWDDHRKRFITFIGVSKRAFERGSFAGDGEIWEHHWGCTLDEEEPMWEKLDVTSNPETMDMACAIDGIGTYPANYVRSTTGDSNADGGEFAYFGRPLVSGSAPTWLEKLNLPSPL